MMRVYHAPTPGGRPRLYMSLSYPSLITKRKLVADHTPTEKIILRLDALQVNQFKEDTSKLVLASLLTFAIMVTSREEGYNLNPG